MSTATVETLAAAIRTRSRTTTTRARRSPPSRRPARKVAA